MNFDELPISASRHSTSQSLDLTRRSDTSQSAEERDRPASALSETEWVSPFTALPPLPPLRKNRGQSVLLRSPEHQRSISSAYYAAAWGSPYATPSPNRSPPSGRSAHNPDFAVTSPLSTREARRTSNIATLVNLDPAGSDSAEPGSSPRKRANSWDRQKSLEERQNWLSESDSGGSEAQFETGKTPTQVRYSKRGPPLSVKGISYARMGSHHPQESAATITPETFNGLDAPRRGEHDMSDSFLNMENPDVEVAEGAEALANGSPVDKPLPSLPLQNLPQMESPSKTAVSDAPLSPSRPKLPSTASFQRPKKKVVWKGKTCVIALPLTDREAAGLPPLLSNHEIKERMQNWADRRHDVDNVRREIEYVVDGSAASGQSRPIYPDHGEISAERSSGKFHVRVPNQAEWDARVEYLKEEKLRALGVTPSISEAPGSTQSPFSTANLSRVSSAFPSLAASPPVGTLSTNGNSIRIAGQTFSPPLSQPGALGSHSGSHVASPLGGFTGSVHGYKQSVAGPNAFPRVTSPNDFGILQTNSVGSSPWQASNAPATRQFSPTSANNMQSLGQVLSPAAPTVPSNDNDRGIPPNSMESILQAQQRQQQFHAQMLVNQHQRQQSLFQQPAKVSELPRTPNLESPTRNTPPEIMHPTPRSHRHNLSAALQKGIDEAEAAHSGQGTDNPEHAENGQQFRRNVLQEAEDEADEQEQDELPVLQRPETIRDKPGDDNDEIETNPSISASPLLIDDKSTFAPPSMSTLKDVLQKQVEEQSRPQSKPPILGHKSKVSLSKFNADAPVFNPRFSGSDWSTAAPATSTPHSQHSRVNSRTDVPTFKPGHTSKASSLSKFNVSAPSFMPTFSHHTPSTSVTTTPAEASMVPNQPASTEKPVFQFNSSMFNVDAPEFKPGHSFSFTAPEFKPVTQPFAFNVENTTTAQAAPALASSGSIFGKVVVESSTKAHRRNATRAVPIVRPKSQQDAKSESGQDDVDDEGRLGAPSDRQKRARTADAEGNNEVKFADGAPVAAEDGLSHDGLISGGLTPLVAPSEAKNNEKDKGEGLPSRYIPPALRKQSEASLRDAAAGDNAREQARYVPPALRKHSDSADEEKHEPTRGEDAAGLTKDENDAAVGENPEAESPAPRHSPIPVAEISRYVPPARRSLMVGEGESIVSNQNGDSSTGNVAEKANAANENALPRVVSSIVPELKAVGPSEGSVTVGRTAASAEETEERPKQITPTLAEAFQPRQSKAVPTEQKPAVQPTQSRSAGLGASRFAATPPPALDAATHSTKISAGLTASRFAAPGQPAQASAPSAAVSKAVAADVVPAEESRPSPIMSPLTKNAQLASQPLYEYIKPEDLDRPVPSSTELGKHHFTPTLPHIDFDASPRLLKSIENQMRRERIHQQASPKRHSESEESRVHDTMPSYEEIDAVMKQFEDDPDLGVERDDSPIKSTPLVSTKLPPHFRSDAPSPTPRRLQEGFRKVSPQRRAQDFGLGIHRLNDSDGEISDWGNDYSPQQEEKLRARAHFFDNHVNDVVDGVLENRLAPLENALQAIQQSLAIGKAGSRNRRGRRSLSTDNKESDADDEDDDAYTGQESWQSYRSKSPSRKERRVDAIRQAVVDALSAWQPPPEQPALDMSEITNVLNEIREHSKKPQQQPASLPDFKALLAEAVAAQPRSPIPVVSDDHEAIQETVKLRMNALESALDQAEQRADGEARLRQQAEDDLQALNKRLLDTQQLLASQQDVHEEAKGSIASYATERELHQQEKIKYEQERGVHQDLQARFSQLQETYAQIKDENKALDGLVKEYRISGDDWREQIATERSRNQDLEYTLQMIKIQRADQTESRQALRAQIDRLQDRMSQVMEDFHADAGEWRRREHELIIQSQKIQAALDHEVRHRSRIENELDDLDKEYRENVRFRTMYETGAQEITRLQNELAQIHADNKVHQDKSFQLERELAHARGTIETEVAQATAALQAELDGTKSVLQSLRSDSAAQISRLENRLDNAELDLEDQKAKHDATLAEVVEGHNTALHEANEKRENALQEQYAAHEKKLTELRERHTRALHNSSDDRHRLEYQFNEKLALSEDKVKHLESKVNDLEERLEITKSAARAAVEAATSKGVNVPTPAPSVVASPPQPPQRAGSASLSLSKGTDLPERISPQALRESIMVLQDQLQNREQKIEHLEQELGKLDKDAPAKIRERENEITMLHELLSVRSDDLTEIISSLSKPDFDRAAVRDAAIRLKANTQMERQLKERAHAIGNLRESLPSISSIASNITQSPRNLPMAAAAAWGNWRRTRDGGSVASIITSGGSTDQTPSRSNSTSPASFLAGIMTPPSTSQRTPPANPVEDHPLSPPSMRPLAGVSTSRKTGGPTGPARPLRSFSTQPRTLASRSAENRRVSAGSASTPRAGEPNVGPESPRTPTMSTMQQPMSARSLDFGEDIDSDASPFEDNGDRESDIGAAQEEMEALPPRETVEAFDG